MAQSYVIIVRTAGRRREYAISAPYMRAGVDYCSTRDFDVWRYYLLSWEANQRSRRAAGPRRRRPR